MGEEILQKKSGSKKDNQKKHKVTLCSVTIFTAKKLLLKLLQEFVCKCIRDWLVLKAEGPCNLPLL